MVLLGLWACGAWTGAAADGLARFEYTEAHMGTSFRIVLYAPDASSGDAGAHAAFAAVGHLDALFSDYRPDSEIGRLAAGNDPGVARPVSQELWDLLVSAKSWSERTSGAFDVTIGPLTRLWRWSSRRGVLPETERLSDARAAVGHDYLVLEDEQRAVRLEHVGMALDLGGIAKGWAADAALRVLRARGLRAALVDAGGDVALGDPPPDTEGWRIRLDADVLVLSNVAVATSGDHYRYAEVDGARFSHVIDPRTGLGVPDAPTVTVVAPDATTADVLASALTVMDTTSGATLLSRVRGAAARVSGSRNWQTETFPRPLVRSDAGADR